MSGQFIKLSGVTAASTAGAPRIVMGAADIAALRAGELLAHVVSAHALTANAAGVNGRCRKTGKLLTSVGTASVMQLRTVAGYVGLGISPVAGAGLALPAGSATASYAAVMSVQVSGGDIAGTSLVNLLNTYTAEGVSAVTGLRYVGGAASADPDTFLAAGSAGSTSGAARLLRPAGDWVIVALDFNDNTMVVSVSTNGGVFNKGQKTTHHTPAANGYFVLGAGLRTSMVGDLYLFNDSLLKTPLGEAQLAAVIAGLKSDYGIA